MIQRILKITLTGYLASIFLTNCFARVENPQSKPIKVKRVTFITVESEKIKLSPEQCAQNTFQLWNKTSKPLYVWIGPNIPNLSKPKVFGSAFTFDSSSSGFYMVIPPNKVAQGDIKKVFDVGQYIPSPFKETDFFFRKVSEEGRGLYPFLIRFFSQNGSQPDIADVQMSYQPLTSGPWYFRVKEENGSLILGPQTGPLGGITGKTESGCPITKNFGDNILHF